MGVVSNQRGIRSTGGEYLHAPAWFRYGVIALAMLTMCACTVPQPKYRVADEGVTFRGQSPDAQLATGSKVRVVPGEIPTHLTADQIQQAQCLPEGFRAAPCTHSGCACCDYGPIRGPNDEYLCDGGDHGLPVGVRADWTITGLEREDTVAHYDTIDGRTIVTPSNKLCIYAPRFAAVRQVVNPVGYNRYDAAGGALQQIGAAPLDESEEATTSVAELEPTIDRTKQPPSLLRERQQGGELARDRRAAEIIGSLAPYANLEIIRSGTLTGEDRVRLARASLAALTWTSDQAAQVIIDRRRAQALVSLQSPGTIYHLFEANNPKLRLCKLASKGAAIPGEEVEFTLRFDNIGDRVIGNVTIVDNLTTRLEYVPDSQKSSLEANFLTTPNEGDSLVLRWEIVEPLQPGQGGVLQFRARVR
jgi:uncharacterized repeat protein (TIGR01451 family)